MMRKMGAFLYIRMRMVMTGTCWNFLYQHKVWPDHVNKVKACWNKVLFFQMYSLELIVS